MLNVHNAGLLSRASSFRFIGLCTLRPVLAKVRGLAFTCEASTSHGHNWANLVPTKEPFHPWYRFQVRWLWKDRRVGVFPGDLSWPSNSLNA